MFITEINMKLRNFFQYKKFLYLIGNRFDNNFFIQKFPSNVHI